MKKQTPEIVQFFSSSIHSDMGRFLEKKMLLEDEQKNFKL